MTDVLDLDALTPDDKPPFRFQFDGQTYTCRSVDEMDVRKLPALLAEAQTDPAAQLAWMLGEDQWNRLEEAEATFTIKHLEAVTDAWLAHHGLDLPKSGGSPKPSRTIRTS